MCGLAGIVTKTEVPASDEALGLMMAALIHRGPDGSGKWVDDRVCLGHQRLAIIDLSSSGQQPMRSADGRHLVIFNGEIYNYRELRAELRVLGAVFRTESDTEVLLEAFRAWGISCVERFNGMWAFAIWDVRNRELVLSRDRFGIKPLYLLENDRILAFASEPKAILAAFPDERRVDELTVAHFIETGEIGRQTETFFERITAFPAAHIATFSVARCSWSRRRYWDLQPERLASEWRGGNPVEDLVGLIDSAVKLQLRSDVPLGSCLSGGLDSSTIVAAMSRHTQVHTYSAVYDEPAYCEQQWIDAVVDRTGAVATHIRPAPDGDLIDDMTTIGWYQDGPSGGAGLYSQFHVMRSAATEVKVLLDGQGGDEIFAGYLPYFRPHLRDLYESGTRGKLRAAVLAAGVVRLWGREFHRGMLTWALGERMASSIVRTRATGALIGPTLRGMAVEARSRITKPPTYSTHLTTAMAADLTTRTLPALLHYEDRNSMAFSIESRVPFLDHRIVEMAFALPSVWKINGSWTKWMLRRAAAPRLPKEVAWRRSKMGYPTPFGSWLRRDPDRAHAGAVLLSKSLRQRGVVSYERIKSLWEEHQQGGVDHAWPLWRIMTLELFYRQFIDSWRPSLARRPGAVQE